MTSLTEPLLERKYNILKNILDENNISILYGNNNDYFDKLNDWINK